MTFQRWALAVLVLCFAHPFQARAQEEIERGATHPSRVEIGATHEHHARVHMDGPNEHADSELRVGLQARIDALNTLAFASPNVADLETATLSRHFLVPIVAPGVRMLDGRLYLGLGLGLSGASREPAGMSAARSGFSLTPMAHYDLLLEGPMALSVGGWLNFARLGETEVCLNNTCMSQNDDTTGWGLSLAAGVHGWLTRGLSLGGEFGWGFLSMSDDRGIDSFVHGLFGTIVLEATIGT